MDWFDSHCHLEMIKLPTDQVIKDSKKLGVNHMVTIGTCEENNKKVLKIINKYPNVYGTVGVHPSNANDGELKYIEKISKIIENNEKIYAIGECGFDQHYDKSNTKIQTQAFIKQLDIAAILSLPVVIHSRSADDLTIKVLESYLKKGLIAILHCFTSGKKLFDFGLKYNCWFSFNAITTFPKSDQLVSIFKEIPINKILIETDAPYLAPAPHRGKINIPGYVSIIGEKLAEMRGMKIQEFKDIVTSNTFKFYKIR